MSETASERTDCMSVICSLFQSLLSMKAAKPPTYFSNT